MNILSFDIEEWFLQKHFYGDYSEMYDKYDFYLGRILDLLDQLHFRATFFCVGAMGEEFPNVIRRIAERGHEIGCHSFQHEWLNKKTKKEVLEDTRMAVDSLAQCVGRKIKSYRAPAFSIGENNKWAFEVLAECGIERDASVFPASREFGGFPQFAEQVPTFIKYQGVEIKEFPIPTTKVFGKQMAYSGGGFFRFYPLWFVKKQMRQNDYNMCYFHMEDIVEDKMMLFPKDLYEQYFKEPGTLKNRYLRYFKMNVGKAWTFGKLQNLLKSMSFCSLNEASCFVDWKASPVVSFE